MFDPSIFELLVICVVALVVLGPDKLPGAIKTLGLWIGRLRRSFNNIKREIEQEVGADEIRRQLRNEAIMEKFNSTKNQVTQSIESVKKEADSIKNDLNLSKEFSGSEEKEAKEETGDQSTAKTEQENADDIDPVEKLATNDPSARVVNQDSDASNKGNDSATDTNTTTDPATDSAEPATKPKTTKNKQDKSGD